MVTCRDAESDVGVPPPLPTQHTEGWKSLMNHILQVSREGGVGLSSSCDMASESKKMEPGMVWWNQRYGSWMGVLYKGRAFYSLNLLPALEEKPLGFLIRLSKCGTTGTREE